MHLSSSITFIRDIGRRAEVIIEVHIPVSGRVTETRDEYLVLLDRGLDLWTTAEIEEAEQALIAAYLLAHPYVLSEAA